MSDNVSCTPDKIDYVISYRESSPDRKKALLYVVSWIHRLFEQINIIIVEQDSCKKLVDSELPYCQLVFVYNRGLFNRGWSNNVGFVYGHRPFLIFADCDIFLHKDAYQACFDALRHFEAVDPKMHYMNNVAVGLSDGQDDASHHRSYNITDKRYGNTFAGAIFCIQRQSLLMVGCWDERFEGWGGEDNVMEHVIRVYLRHCRLQLQVCHIEHARTILDSKLQPNYQQNSERSRAICAVHGLALLEYVQEKKQRQLGDVDKYSELTGLSAQA